MLALYTPTFLYYLVPWMIIIWALCTSSVPSTSPFWPARKIRTRLVTFEWYMAATLEECLIILSFLLVGHSVACVYQFSGLHNLYEAWQLAGYHSTPSGICEVTATQQMADEVHWIVGYRDIMGTQVHVQKVPNDSPYVDPRLLTKGSKVPCYDYDYYHYNTPHRSEPQIGLPDREQLQYVQPLCSDGDDDAPLENDWPIVISPPRPITMTTFYKLFLSFVIELLICLFFLRSGPIFFYRFSQTKDDAPTGPNAELNADYQEEQVRKQPEQGLQEVHVQPLAE